MIAALWGLILARRAGLPLFLSIFLRYNDGFCSENPKKSSVGELFG